MRKRERDGPTVRRERGGATVRRKSERRRGEEGWCHRGLVPS